MTWRAFFSCMADDVAAALDNGQPLPEGAAFQLHEALERDRPGFGIVRHADGWRVTFEGESRHVPDCRGMDAFAYLLQRPEQPVSVAELWTLGRGEGELEDWDGFGPESLAQPVNDAQAVATYRELLLEYDAEMETCPDPDRMAELMDMHAAVKAALSGPRLFQSNPVNTLKERLRACHKLVAKHHPDAGAYLNGRVTRDGFEHTYSGVRFLPR